jgi:hypothetical protein
MENKTQNDWKVSFCAEFEPEFRQLPSLVRQELAARVNLLKQIGPTLGRPYIDTLNGSRYNNMKEIRFKADDGVWRVAFAFDPTQCVILLVAGDKAGVSETQFYKKLVKKADQRFEAHLQTLKK